MYTHPNEFFGAYGILPCARFDERIWDEFALDPNTGDFVKPDVVAKWYAPAKVYIRGRTLTPIYLVIRVNGYLVPCFSYDYEGDEESRFVGQLVGMKMVKEK
jgi:hypothetical protein